MRSLLVLLVACSAAPPPLPPPELEPRFAAQQHAVEAFFGATMPRPYAVHVVPTHAAMVAFAAKRWKLPDLPCWAVAMGTGTTLLLLDPPAWKTEACDHANDGPAEVDKVIAHELVHVFHGQHRPDDMEFEQADAIDWFVEGLAIYAAGQLDDERLAQVSELVRSGNEPKRLADAWSGKARYAVSGTLVRLIDRRIGRTSLRGLLPLSKPVDLLAAIGMTESELLEAWQTSVGDSAP
jgi:hypothetical protein